jgi:hypothetical protein
MFAGTSPLVKCGVMKTILKADIFTGTLSIKNLAPYNPQNDNPLFPQEALY